jgi:hypothetical protein
MKTFTFASLIAAAAAFPAGNEARQTPNPDLSTFELVTLRSASDIHFTRFSAAKSNLYVHLPNQDASCLSGADGNEPAVFQLNTADKTLWLYATGNPRQQIYVDRSGMGQGKIGYTTGAQPTPRNAEREGWEVDANGILKFDGADMVACPGYEDGAWGIWLGPSATPGGSKDCLGFSARTAEVEKPNDCWYTS